MNTMVQDELHVRYASDEDMNLHWCEYYNTKRVVRSLPESRFNTLWQFYSLLKDLQG